MHLLVAEDSSSIAHWIPMALAYGRVQRYHCGLAHVVYSNINGCQLHYSLSMSKYEHTRQRMKASGETTQVGGENDAGVCVSVLDVHMF